MKSGGVDKSFVVTARGHVQVASRPHAVNDVLHLVQHMQHLAIALCCLAALLEGCYNLLDLSSGMHRVVGISPMVYLCTQLIVLGDFAVEALLDALAELAPVQAGTGCVVSSAPDVRAAQERACVLQWILCVHATSWGCDNGHDSDHVVASLRARSDHEQALGRVTHLRAVGRHGVWKRLHVYPARKTAHRH